LKHGFKLPRYLIKPVYPGQLLTGCLPLDPRPRKSGFSSTPTATNGRGPGGECAAMNHHVAFLIPFSFSQKIPNQSSVSTLRKTQSKKKKSQLYTPIATRMYIPSSQAPRFYPTYRFHPRPYNFLSLARIFNYIPLYPTPTAQCLCSNFESFLRTLPRTSLCKHSTH
jgi:hypothetical protein